MAEERPDLGMSIAVIQRSAGGAIQPLATADSGDLRPRQAETDDQLVALWLHGRSRHTQRAYRADANRFRSFQGKPLRSVTLGDLQTYSDALDASKLVPGSRNRLLAAIKSLFAFGHRLGYLPFDVARPLRLTPTRDSLAERILAEPDVQRLIALEPNPRNRALLLMVYASGVRVSEASGLRWRDVQTRADGGQITVFGKGGKTRAILLPASVWSLVMALRGERTEDDPVYRSRKGKPLSPSQMLRIVKQAAAKAGIPSNVVVHTLRHCHASHSLERGAPIHLVQATLGHAQISTTGKYLHARPTDSSSKYLGV